MVDLNRRKFLRISNKIKSVLPLLIIFISVIVYYGCNSRENNRSNLILVRGTIQNAIGKRLYLFSYADTLSVYLGKKTVLDTVVLEEDGNFNFELESMTSVIFDIQDGDSVLAVNMFACPGDELQVNFSDRSRQPEIYSSTPVGKFNTFLVKFLYAFYHEPSVKREYYIATNYMDGHSFLVYNTRREKAQLDFFTEYFKGDSIRPDYRNYAYNSIRYGIAIDRLMYVWKKRMKGEQVTLDSSFYDFEKKEFLENQEAILNPTYVHFLNLYIKNTYERMVDLGEIKFTNNNVVDPVVEKYKLTCKLLSRPYRDIVLYSLFQSDDGGISIDTKSSEGLHVSMDTLIHRFTKKHSIE